MKLLLGGGGGSEEGDIGGVVGGEGRGGGRHNEDAQFCAARARAATEGYPLKVRSRPRVRFNQQIRVVLVPSRGDMSSVKADVWWGEGDYCYFRWECCKAINGSL